MDLIASCHTCYELRRLTYYTNLPSLLFQKQYDRPMNMIFFSFNHQQVNEIPFAFTDICDSEPCQNGGNCLINSDSAAHLCLCVHGYTGNFCEIGMLQYMYKGGI